MHQIEFNLVGGKAVHPSWEPYFNNCSPQSSRGMAATLYTTHQGQPITKKEIRLLWKSFELGWFVRCMFTPDVLAILHHYDLICKGHPSDNWVSSA
jgi:hypothetical protein